MYKDSQRGASFWGPYELRHQDYPSHWSDYLCNCKPVNQVCWYPGAGASRLLYLPALRLWCVLRPTKAESSRGLTPRSYQCLQCVEHLAEWKVVEQTCEKAQPNQPAQLAQRSWRGDNMRSSQLAVRIALVAGLVLLTLASTGEWVPIQVYYFWKPFLFGVFFTKVSVKCWE